MGHVSNVLDGHSVWESATAIDNVAWGEARGRIGVWNMGALPYLTLICPVAVSGQR